MFVNIQLAGSGPFFSLNNSDFVVLLGFLLFVGVLVALKVPGKIGAALDARADKVKNDLEEARKLREEAQSILAEFERKQNDVKAQSEAIIAAAKKDAENAAEQAKLDLQASVARRLATAEDQIASAEAAAVSAVKNKAVAVATAAAREVLAANVSGKKSASLIDDSIKIVSDKLH